MTKNLVIFDLDGTLANIEHRLKHIKPPIGSMSLNPGYGAVEIFKQNWDAFYDACHNDTPIYEVIEIMLALHSVGFEIWIVTGRSDVVKDKTLTWLRRHAMVPDKILMRPAKGHMPTAELKEAWVKDGTIPADRVMCVFEDRPPVVAMWRRNGIKVMEVEDGGGLA